MEMNTRLQVEHPVTEMITGLDLVEWQLRIAAGEPLPLSQDQLEIKGHAIEARIYAENPDKGFLPSVGKLLYLGLPDHVAFERGDIRVDGGVRSGDTISPFYDPMIAKLIVWGENRDQARARMIQALGDTQVVGVHTNVAFLSRLMSDAAFAASDLDTGLIERQRQTLLPPPHACEPEWLALACAALLASESASAQVIQDPWSRTDGWRLDGCYRRELHWLDQNTQRKVAYRVDQHGTFFVIDGVDAKVEWRRLDDVVPGAHALQISWNGRNQTGKVIRDRERFHLFSLGRHAVLTFHDPLAHADEQDVEQCGWPDGADAWQDHRGSGQGPVTKSSEGSLCWSWKP